MEIQSKTRSYLHFKYPFLYFIQFVSFPIAFIFWLFGVVLGLYFVKTETTFSTLSWIVGWALAVWFTYYWGIWYKCGQQIIAVENESIRVTKKFMFYRRDKVLLKKRIITIDYKELKPFNVFTGRAAELKSRLGWLVINGDLNYWNNSYLYPVEDLETLIKYYCDKMDNL